MEKSKEIDIVGLFAELKLFLKKYIIIIGAFSLVGLGIGIADFFFGNNFYKTSFVASSPVINNQIVYELVQPINYYINNNLYDSVAAKLQIDKKIAAEIKSISIDTTINQAVKIEMEVYNKESVQIIQNGLMTYFNSIPFITNTINNRRKHLQDYIASIDSEIEELQTLQKTVQENLESNQLEGIISAGGMYSEMIDLFETKSLLESEYNGLQSFKVISVNVVFVSQKSLNKNLILFTCIGIILGLLASGLLALNKKVTARIKGQ